MDKPRHEEVKNVRGQDDSLLCKGHGGFQLKGSGLVEARNVAC